MVNKVFLIGRLTAKPTFDTASTGTSYSRFTVAANRQTADKQVDFIPCVAFRKTAELANQYLDKGSLISVEGRISVSNYTNNDGRNMTRIEVVVERLTFLETRNSSQSRSNNFSKNKKENLEENFTKTNDSNDVNDFDDVEFVFE